MEHVSLAVFDYSGNKVCDLYDSHLNVPGQAYDISLTLELGGWKQLDFTLPYMMDGKSNFRWRYIKNEFKVRFRQNGHDEWFIINAPKKNKKAKDISSTVQCSHISASLKTKNLYVTFDDENGIGTISYLLEQAIKNTGWQLGYVQKLCEKDGVTEKIRSISSNNKAGAYQLVTNICNLFNAYPVYNSDHTIDIYGLKTKLPQWEATIGRNLETISVEYKSDDIITRMYVEGEYGDHEYIGIDDVEANESGMSFIFNFDYYKEIGAFTQVHQAAVDRYVAAMKQLKSDSMGNATSLIQKEDELNELWGQIRYVFIPVENGQLQTDRTIIGGTVPQEKRGLVHGDKVVLLDGAQMLNSVVNEDGEIEDLDENTRYVIKFITLPAGLIGGKQVGIESKLKVIQQTDKEIAAIQKLIDSIDPQIEGNQQKIKAYEQEIEDKEKLKATYEADIVTTRQGKDEQGAFIPDCVFSLYNRAAALVIEISTLGNNQTGYAATQDQLEWQLSDALGDMLKDGYWSNTNYIAGQQDVLYEDALEMSAQLGKPTVKYQIALIPMALFMGVAPELIKLNSAVRIYDEQLQVNEIVYVTKIVRGIDNKKKGSVEISDEDITISGKSFDSIMKRVTEIADLIQQKEALYNRVDAISPDGLIGIERLEGTIDVLRTKLLSTGSSWYTDDNGNIVFESVDGNAAMMLCGEGFMLANGKNTDGSWNWRTFGTGGGFTADMITTGFISADRIQTNSITANHLNSQVGKSLDLSSNTSITATVQNIINNNISYAVDITSSVGMFLSDTMPQTVLTATLMFGSKSVDSEFEASAYSWTRDTGREVQDNVWNNNTAHKATKTISITRDDVLGNARFSCSVKVVNDDGETTYVGMISIADLNESDNIDLYINANKPVVQTYDPNTGIYVPDWSTSNLVLTPTVFVNGAQKTNTNVFYTWRKITGGTESGLGINETVSNGVLTVGENLVSASAEYLCIATYSDPVTGRQSTVQKSKSFSRLEAQLRTKRCEIKGATPFVIDVNGTASPTSITLFAELDNVTLVEWQYRNASGQWVKYPNSTTSSNLLMLSSDNVFVNGAATIRVVTNDDYIYDTQTIHKVEAGVDNINVMLTNESMRFPANLSGSLKQQTYTCNVIAYVGKEKVAPVIKSINLNGFSTRGLSASWAIDTATKQAVLSITTQAGTNLGSANYLMGNINVTLSYPVTDVKTINWQKYLTSNTGGQGTEGVSFMLYTPNGNVFSDDNSLLIIQATAFDGAADITQVSSYSWQKFNGVGYTPISGQSGSSLIVSRDEDDIVSSGIYRCNMTYNGTIYRAIASLIDKTDSYQAAIASTVGDIISEDTAQASLRCLVYENGSQIDATGTSGNPYTWAALDSNGNPVTDASGVPIAFPSAKSIPIRPTMFTGTVIFVCTTVGGAMAQKTIQRKSNMVVSNIEPGDISSRDNGMLWLDTSNGQDILKRWDKANSMWVVVNSVPQSVTQQLTEFSEGLELLQGQINQYVKQVDYDAKIGAIETSITNVTQTAASIRTEVTSKIQTNAQTAYSDTAAVATDLSKLNSDVTTYMEFAQDGLTIGKNTSNFKTKLSESELAFMDGDEKVAYVNDSKLHITYARVTDQLSIGNENNGYFDWVTVGEGLALKWRGKIRS